VWALQVRAVVEPWNPVLFVSWLRETFAWWPVWAGFLIAAILVLIPAKGRVGIGLGILAGLAVVPNVWRPYAPTLIVAILLVIGGMWGQWRWRGLSRASHQADLRSGRAMVEPSVDRASGV
jgi:hypothetical protein